MVLSFASDAMIDIFALPLPLHLLLVLFLLPLSLARVLYQRLILRPKASPNISPASYTPLPSPLQSPPLSIPYAHHFVETPTSRVHYVTTQPSSPASATASSDIPLLFVHGFPDFVSPIPLPSSSLRSSLVGIILTSPSPVLCFPTVLLWLCSVIVV